VLKLLDTPRTLRPDWLKMIEAPGGGDTQEAFMLVEVDTATLPASAFRAGLNRLYVQLSRRRDGALTDLFMGELEVVTSAPGVDHAPSTSTCENDPTRSVKDEVPNGNSVTETR